MRGIGIKITAQRAFEKSRLEARVTFVLAAWDAPEVPFATLVVAVACLLEAG